MAGIGSRACRLHVPARKSRLPRELPELYAKPYSLTVNFQSLHFYFSCMHSARMLRSTSKNITDCAILSWNLSILDRGSRGGASSLERDHHSQVCLGVNFFGIRHRGIWAGSQLTLCRHGGCRSLLPRNPSPWPIHARACTLCTSMGRIILEYEELLLIQFRNGLSSRSL